MRVEYFMHCNNTGYGKAGKHYVLKLIQLGHMVSVKPIGKADLKDDTIDNQIKALIDKNIGKPDCRIIHAIPHTHIALSTVQNDGVFTFWFYAWELSILPSMYKEVLAQADHCVTFAPWQVETYVKNTGKDNISYLPHVTMDKIGYQKRTWNAPFTFFSMLRWDERKDPVTLIKAFLYAFNANNPVRLLLKVSAISAHNANLATNMIMKSARLNKTYPTITVIPNDLTDDEMNKLYEQADVFISTTRGEGWGLGFNEALLRGIPVIYPDSPYLVKHFFTKENSISVPTRNILVYNSSFPQQEDNMIWSQTDEIALVNIMRHMVVNHKQLFQLPVHISEAYTKEQDTIDTYFNDILSKVR